MVRLAALGEIEEVMKKMELGFELEDRDVWISMELLRNVYIEKLKNVFFILNEALDLKAEKSDEGINRIFLEDLRNIINRRKSVLTST